MRNATPVLPFKTRRPTRRHYFLRVNFRPFSFFMRTTCAKMNPGHVWDGLGIFPDVVGEIEWEPFFQGIVPLTCESQKSQWNYWVRLCLSGCVALTFFEHSCWNGKIRCKSGPWIQTVSRIGLKSWSVRPCPDICRHATFHPNPCTRFWVILQTDRPTDRQTCSGMRAKTYLLFCRR